MDFPIFLPYDWGGDIYGEALILRNRLLRLPLGLCLYDEDLEKEKAYLHFGAFLDGLLVSTLMLVPESYGLYRMKQVATAEAKQGKGIGMELLQFCEEFLRDEGASGIVLHARKTAQGFYEKAGYTPVGEPFLEVGIPHQAMEKRW